MNELKEQFGENPYELKNILKNDLVNLCLNLICQLVHAFFLFLPMM